MMDIGLGLRSAIARSNEVDAAAQSD